jgi:catechol 2,3-dioxygenase-like lactoylglutathione lyase family enzyme
MIHHVGVFASDHGRSRRFYWAALEPLGIIVGYEADGVSEFWHRDADTPSLSLERANDLCTRDLHIAFAAENREAVDAFFELGIAAGGTERHAPRYWPEYRAYCAFLSDPDGNNVEAVHK